MNERIRELLNEATVGLEPDLSPQRTVTFNEMQKFAELIVRDCVSIVEKRKGWIDYENIDTSREYMYGYEKAVNHCSMFIKEYFGVNL